MHKMLKLLYDSLQHIGSAKKVNYRIYLICLITFYQLVSRSQGFAKNGDTINLEFLTGRIEYV